MLLLPRLRDTVFVAACVTAIIFTPALTPVLIDPAADNTSEESSECFTGDRANISVHFSHPVYVPALTSFVVNEVSLDDVDVSCIGRSYTVSIFNEEQLPVSVVSGVFTDVDVVVLFPVFVPVADVAGVAITIS